MPKGVFRITINFECKLNTDWVVVKNYDKFLSYIMINAIPELILLDYEIGNYLLITQLL